MLCRHCREHVVAPFLDVEHVLGLPAPAGESAWLGEADVGRRAVDLVAAFLSGEITTDPAGTSRLRSQAAARPGATVDSLTLLAASLAYFAAGRSIEQAGDLVRDLGMRHELALIVSPTAERP